MKKPLMIFCVIISCVILLASCNQNNESSQPQVENSENSQSQMEMGGIYHGVSNPDPNTAVLKYDGEPIKIKYLLRNEKIDNVWGIQIFVNGYLQPYTVDQSSSEEILHFVKMKKNEEMYLNISFSPVIGSKNDVLTVHFVVMLRPDYIHTDNNKIVYGSYHTITQLQPWKLNINHDVEKKSEASIDLEDIEHSKTEINDKIDSYYKNGNETEEWAENNVNFSFIKDGIPSDKLIVEKSKNVKLIINGAGKNKKFSCDKYRVSVFVNHKIIPAFDGNYYCDIIIEEGKQVDLPIKIDTTNLAKNNFIYIYAVPLLDQYSAEAPIVEKSGTIGLVVE